MVMTRQKMVNTLFVMFFVVLAGLTFLSNTFQAAMLPKVTTEKPAQNSLTHRMKGSGTVTPREKTDLTSDSGWKVAKVHVNKNDGVQKGQILVTIDDSVARAQLSDEEDRLKKQGLNRELLKEQFVAAQQEGDEAKIRKAKRDLESDQLDMDIARRKIDGMRKDLAEKAVLKAPFDGRVSELKAKEGLAASPGQPLMTLVNSGEGYSFSFSVDADLAAMLQIGEAVHPIVVKDGKPLNVKGTIAELNDAPSSSGGSTGGIAQAGGGSGETAGTSGGGAKPQKTVVIDVTGDSIQGGEQATVQIERQSSQKGLVIRKEMLRQDGAGSYVFIVREKKSPLGNTYYAQKVKVTTGEETEEGIIVLSGLALKSDIITESSEPLQEGNRIRLQ
ncbi:hypothetical protein PAESOLCIP111_04109 [Paenibacillus solanacearum]|uniref:Efflux RND transporter periplasmic adaptor subunit n=1 Tax=Paenibacillus solanacearum TaxID=2048548 RepID=A0A916K6R0_9BACL|nr:HlyD family efflux transporter periplasmic adaptor subunit [Paenibacillus solanacearum]CAG7640173.1 hypothetical protein PAESOLCIP111_04109 [Paenibacillus solanacearum]